MRKILLILIVSVVSFTWLVFVNSQGLKNAVPELGKLQGPVGASNDVPTVVGTVINAALTMVGLVFFALMIYAGYLWMTDRGKEEQVKKAQNIIITSVIGIVIVLAAYAITAFVLIKFGVG